MEKKLTKKREAILRESFKLFLSKGYDAVSFPDIERAAQVTRGAIFHHFNNKEDLFKHVAEQFIFAFLEDVDYGEEYLSSPTPLKDFINRCLIVTEERMMHFLQGLDANITTASFMSFILYLKDHYETWGKTIEVYEEKTLKDWSNAINLAKERGELVPDADTILLAKTFLHLYLGLSFKGAMIDKLSISELRKQWGYIYEQQLIK
ncbi:MAG: helix-turn-helix domain-containing protein [Porphyromonas sp.]|nr:helix-turn-helix domain-containing protein [Porphyromonas sp.]